MSENKSKEIDYATLRFIRIFTPLHIPKELIEQVRDRCFEIDDWYAYQEQICTKPGPNGPMLNPFSLLYVIADEGNKVVGMLWCEIQALSKTLIIQTFSMDRKYWGRGKAVQLLADKAKEIARECKLKKINWSTNYPKHSERYGFKRSKGVVMEYMEEEDGRHDDGQRETHRECSDDDRGTKDNAERDDTGTGTGGEPGTNESIAGRANERGGDAKHLPDGIYRPSDDELRTVNTPSDTAAVC